MASAIPERVELAKLCSSRDWSKAIRILDKLLSQSCSIQDICNRAYCYSQLELHKHVIKDCDRALQLDPELLQAYILKGRAYLSLGRKEDAVAVWEQGYEHALQRSADLKQLLELEELLSSEKHEKNVTCENHVAKSSGPCGPISKPGLHINGKSSDNSQSNHMTASCGPSMTVAEVGAQINGKLGDKPNLNCESLGRPENQKKSVDEGRTDKDSSCKGSQGLNSDSQVNGNHEVSKKLSFVSKSCNTSSGSTSQSHQTLPLVSSKSGNASEIRNKGSNKSDDFNEINDDTKRNGKFSVTRISKTKSISVDFRLSRGIAQVNEGNYHHAISIFNQILREDPNYPEALIGRGTAYAFQRELDAAIADFTKAIESNPSAGEAWKRRGQAQAALGESVQAIADLTKALEFEQDSADILHERGIVNFKFKDFGAAVEDLTACVKLDKGNKSAYTYLGLALASIGEYKRAEEAHLKSIQLDQNFLEAWIHLTQFFQDLANPTKALDCLQQIQRVDGRYAKAYHLRGLLFHGMGEHRKAIMDLSTALSIDDANIEALYLRASCHHAVGEYGEAVKDYDAALDLELDSMEKFVLQCLAFYQKEIALYTASKVNSEFCWFDIDGDIDPLFKEYWCKRLHPKDVCEKVFRQPPLCDSLRKGKIKKQDFTITKHKAALIQAADSIGKRIQYDCIGFLSNRRQHRMAGLAVIEVAQKVSKAWRSLQAEWKYANKSTSKTGRRSRRRERISMASQNRGGPGCSTSSSEPSTSYSSIDDRPSKRLLSWHDVYSLAVRWRQISEPCDPVVWINKLSGAFMSGFGSHTPMILGQAKVVCYFPNYERTLEAAKAIVKDKSYVHNKGDDKIDLSNDGKLEATMQAKSCSDIYKIIGEDFWVATFCRSTAFEGKQLEGTRITLMKMVHGFDFSIRTPCTPSRWEDFDAEMTAAWEAICNAYCGETYGSTDFNALEKVRDAILRMSYYWYNFMPLSRGSAVVGFIVLLGLLLAANMEFTGSIPKGLQVDWEAILNSDPDSFMDTVKTWLYPSLKVTTSWKDYPDVSSTFATTGSVVAALSSYD